VNHANHAPETHRHRPAQDPPPPIPANFTYVRVKKTAQDSDSLETTVPLDFAAGITAKLRAYRETPEQTNPSLEYQIAPTDPVLTPPMIPDNSPTPDPLYLKSSYIGTITVQVPGGGPPRVLTVTSSHEDAVAVDLTKGVDVKCCFDLSAVHSFPIGPMLNIDIAPQM
jgi:hypothetical protein